MPNTYTQLYVHVVFAVKGRANLVSNHWKEQLYKYITGIITHKNQKVLAINGMPDHLHVLIGLKPDCMLSDLIRDIKSNTSKWVNEKKWVPNKFEWQTGFGAFTVGQSQLETIMNYIIKQEEHHKTKTFRQEYMAFLDAYKIEFSQDYIFEEYSVAPTELDIHIDK